MFKRLDEDVWDDEYTVKSLKEFFNSPHIDDDFPVRLGISEWNFSKSCNFYARQITSSGKPFVCLESMEINNDYNEIYDKWIDKKIENNKLKKENKELQKENKQLKSELSRYKEVNRLDIWKSSYSSEDALITELQNKCDKKQEHIVLLENKIHRMRENIKRLEALYHYRGYIGSGDVKKEYYRMEKLLRAENNKLKKENEELKRSIDDMGGRLQGLWANYNENRWGIWGQAVEDVAKELGFKIHTIYDAPISNSDSKKERINGVKKLSEIICENKQLKQEVETLQEELAHFLGDVE